MRSRWVTWPRNRLLGYQATLREHVDLLAGPVCADEPEGLRLNVSTGARGRVRVALLDAQYQAIEGHDVDDCDGLAGDHLSGCITWNGSTRMPGGPSGLIARVELEDASLWAFSFGASDGPRRDHR